MRIDRWAFVVLVVAGFTAVGVAMAMLPGGTPVRISMENPPDWITTAEIVSIEDEDAIYFEAALGPEPTPFVFSIRRLEDGRVVIEVPHQRDLPVGIWTLRETSPGELLLGYYDGHGNQGWGGEVILADD